MTKPVAIPKSLRRTSTPSSLSSDNSWSAPSIMMQSNNQVHAMTTPKVNQQFVKSQEGSLLSCLLKELSPVDRLVMKRHLAKMNTSNSQSIQSDITEEQSVVDAESQKSAFPRLKQHFEPVVNVW